MPALHVAQINFLQAPAGLAADAVLEQWHSLVDIAEAAASSGTRVSVIQAAWHTQRLDRNGVDYCFVDMRGANDLATRSSRLAEVIGDIQANVLHVHGLGFAEDTFALSQRLPPLPILLQDHADRPPRWWRRAQWRRWHAVASGVVFTSPELARPFTAAGVFGPRTQLFAIPESSSRFTPGSRVEARAETGLRGEPCVLWVGHLNPGKDPLTVLDGVARAAQQLPGLQLWCAFGTAPLLAEVRARIDGDLRLAGRVHLLGKVPHAQIEALMRAADLFVSGSLAESCGYAALEAMACGITPVLTDIPSFRALTRGGHVGKLWRCGDAVSLAAALTSAEASPLSPARVRAHFDATLSLTAVGRQWAEAYAQVLERWWRRAG